MRLLFAPFGKFDFPDFSDSLPESETVECLDSQAREDFDSILKFPVDTEKEASLRIIASFKGRGVGDSPVRGDWLTRPHWALLGSRLVADRENEIEAGAVRRSELVPAFRAQIFGCIVQLVQQLERQRMHGAFGMASGAVSFELSPAPPSDRALGHDAAR